MARFEIRDDGGTVLAASADEVDAIALLRAFAWAADEAEDEITMVAVDAAGVPVGRSRRVSDL